MNQHIQKALPYIKEKNEQFIGLAVIAVLVLIVVIVAVFVNASTPKVVYQPADACQLFTVAEAKELLGSGALQTNVIAPVQTKNIAKSSCGYADGNPDKDSMIVAAIVVRAGINDDGINQNVTEFNQGKPSSGIEAIENLGDSAYFNAAQGQLNVLDGKNWILISYGKGSDPLSNTVEDAATLARKVID